MCYVYPVHEKGKSVQQNYYCRWHSHGGPIRHSFGNESRVGMGREIGDQNPRHNFVRIKRTIKCVHAAAAAGKFCILDSYYAL